MKKFALLELGLIVCLAARYAEIVIAQPLIPEGRIISGYEARLGQFPWQVLIKEDEHDDLLCGGSILSSRWVATAAHCCKGKLSLLLRFGTVELENNDDLSMTVSEMHIHPNYDPKTYNNDVCLIKLPSELEFSNTIAPIPLVPISQASNKFVGSVAVISGFGIMSDEYLDASENLLWAQIKIIENYECAKVFKKGLIIESTICGKGYDVANMSICNGDSGGPMITRDENGNFMQIGINSFVPLDQCTDALPSAYARISSFLSYIYNITDLPQI